MRQGRGGLFYGWYIVAACFVVNFVVFGISVNTITVYVKPIEAEMGWLRGEISAAVMIAALAMGVAAAFVVGRLIDRVGARVVMAAGATVVGLVSMLLAQAQSLLYFYALFVVSGAGQAAATLIPISLVISNWFEAKRGKALGLAMTGTGLGAMVMVPVTTWVVVGWGWRTSFFVMGCVILLTVPLTLLLIRTRPSDMDLLPDGGEGVDAEPARLGGLSLAEALRTPAFWLIGSMMMIAGLVGLGIGVHLMPYLTDIGHPEATAGLIIGIISGLTVVGKLGLGVVADGWGLQRTVILAYAAIAIGILLLMGVETLAAACVFAVVYGFAIGAPLLINPALTAECMGLANFGAVFGVLMLLNTVGAAAGAVLTGVVYDNVGSYLPAFTVFVVLTLVAGCCGVMARRLSPIEAAGS